MEQRAKRKIPLWVKIALVVLVVVVLAGVGLFAKIRYEQSVMAPLATGEVVPGVFAVNNGFVNSYLVASGGQYLMIDAGNSVAQTEAALEQLGIAPEAVKTVLLTHSDSDHTAALALFPGASVYLPGAEEQMIDGTTRRSPLGGNRLEREYVTLNDGEEIELLGLDIHCIATPGHTPGSMSFLVDGRYLFVGDTLSLREGRAATFNAFYNMDSDMQRESIRKLAVDTQPEVIFTGHYGYTDDTSTAFAEWR